MGENICVSSAQQGKSRAEGVGGQHPQLANGSVYLDGCFQRRLGGQRMEMLHISAEAVKSCSCQHSLGFLPENCPAAFQGLHLE